MKRHPVIAAGAFAMFLPATAMAQTTMDRFGDTFGEATAYGTIHGGLNLTRDTDFGTGLGTIDTDFNRGFAAGGALGLDMGRIWQLGGLRVEAEGMFRRNSVDVHALEGQDLPGSTGRARAVSGMVNVLHDFHWEGPFALRPYFGGGIGAARVRFQDFGVEVAPDVLDDRDTAFAFQGIVGASFDVTPAMAVTADYRYFATRSLDMETADGTDISPRYQNHTIMAGLRFNF